MASEQPSPRRAHLSFSALKDWVSCPKAYQLKRLLGLTPAPSWPAVGGSAVHAAIEAFNRASLTQDNDA